MLFENRDSEEVARRNLREIQTFNLIKNAVWSCVIVLDPEVARKDQNVDLKLLYEVMSDIKVYIDFAKLKRASPTHSKTIKGTGRKEVKEDNLVRHILKRFTFIDPAMISHTLKKCEELGLITK